MRKVTDVVTCSHTAGALRRPGTQQVKGLNRKWRWKPRRGLQARILPYPISNQPWPFCVCVVGRERGLAQVCHILCPPLATTDL